MTDVRLRGRDAVVIELITDHYAAPISTIRRALDVGTSVPYRVVARWRAAGLVDTGTLPTRLPGGAWSSQMWVWPTRETAWSILGYDPGPYRPKPSTTTHLQAVFDVRLALHGVDLDPETGWTSERSLRHAATQAANEARRRGRKVDYPHIHDGWSYDAEGRRYAVEVELTRKNTEALEKAMVAALEQANEHDLAGVEYYTRGPDVRRAVEAAADRLRERRGTTLLQRLCPVIDLDTFLAEAHAHPAQRPWRTPPRDDTGRHTTPTDRHLRALP